MVKIKLMKIGMLSALCIIAFNFYADWAFAFYKEIWMKKCNDGIEKLQLIDSNKNNIKEILVLSGYKRLYLLGWDKHKGEIIEKWESSKFSDGIDIKYYDFNNFLLIQKYDLAVYYTLFLKNGEYALKEIKESMIPSWKGEEYIRAGSFKKRGEKDIFLTSSSGTSPHKKYLNIRETRLPNKLLWTSTFQIQNVSVQLFGDFDNDKKIELLIIPYNDTKIYWISPKEDKFEGKEMDNSKRWLFPIRPSNPEKQLKAGRTAAKNFDELFFIYIPSYYGGPLYKAVWQKDRFEVEEILSTKGIMGYDNLNLADMDNDGLDEIIISEIRGDLVETEEEPFIKNHRDVIHIVKWNGKEYKKIWTSKPLGAITQILVDDMTGDGKKEIVVGNAKGELHIFGQK